MAPAFCGVHPAVPAVDLCSRCGTFVCYACIESVLGEPTCGPCARVLSKIDQSLPTRLKLAWLLAVLGAVAFPVGMAGAFMALTELRQARRRFAPATIEERAEGALRMSAITILANIILLWNVWAHLHSLRLGR